MYVLSLVSISSHSVISFVKDVVPEQLNRSRINQRDSLSEQLLQLTVVLKTVFLEEKFESQELSLFVDNGESQRMKTIFQIIKYIQRPRTACVNMFYKTRV